MKLVQGNRDRQQESYATVLWKNKTLLCFSSRVYATRDQAEIVWTHPNKRQQNAGASQTH